MGSDSARTGNLAPGSAVEFRVISDNSVTACFRPGLGTMLAGVEAEDFGSAAKDGETAPRAVSGVTIISDFSPICSFVSGNDNFSGAHEGVIAFVPSFDEVEGVGRTVAVFLASTGKPVPMAKKQIL
jgi:hypothetical protein